MGISVCVVCVWNQTTFCCCCSTEIYMTPFERKCEHSQLKFSLCWGDHSTRPWKCDSAKNLTDHVVESAVHGVELYIYGSSLLHQQDWPMTPCATFVFYKIFVICYTRTSGKYVSLAFHVANFYSLVVYCICSSFWGSYIRHFEQVKDKAKTLCCKCSQ